MAFSPYQVLAVVIIAYFVPASVASLLLWIRRGLGGRLCWVYLFVLSLARITGSSLQIASEMTGNIGMAKAARFMATMGIVPLLLVMLGIIEHVKSKSSKPNTIPRIVWIVLHTIHWTAFIVSIIAAARGSSSLSKATIVLFSAAFVVQAVISMTFLAGNEHFNCDRWLVLSTPISVPFIAIRVLFGLLSTFQVSSEFDRLRPNIFALSFMQYLMEFAVIALFLAVGLFRKANEPAKNREGEDGSSSLSVPLNRV